MRSGPTLRLRVRWAPPCRPGPSPAPTVTCRGRPEESSSETNDVCWVRGVNRGVRPDSRSRSLRQSPALFVAKDCRFASICRSFFASGFIFHCNRGGPESFQICLAAIPSSACPAGLWANISMNFTAGRAPNDAFETTSDVDADLFPEDGMSAMCIILRQERLVTPPGMRPLMNPREVEICAQGVHLLIAENICLVRTYMLFQDPARCLARRHKRRQTKHSQQPPRCKELVQLLAS